MNKLTIDEIINRFKNTISKLKKEKDILGRLYMGDTEIIEDKTNILNRDIEIFNYYLQLLEELKAYREIGTVDECKNSVLDILKAYNKALDNFAERALTMIDAYDGLLLDKRAIEHIRAELKAGVENE